ncbi:MAG: S41 family peptidase [Chloroflexi bacterium]|nr:S41 family peptidase [Chloroflexota bacterium]
MKGIWRYLLAAALVLAIVAGTFAGGFALGYVFHGKQPVTGAATIAPSSSSPSPNATENAKDLWAPFWEAWDLLHKYYVRPLDDVKLVQGAIRGMYEATGDPHTSYMDPDEFRQANIALEGEYEGIGAWVDTSGDYVTIVSPMKNSPAEKAGLQPGDEIIAVDGEDVTGVNPELVVRRVLGPAGTKVRLTIKRDDQPPFDVVITRAKITIPSVEGKMLDNNIAYVQLLTFGDKTSDELRDTLKELMAQNPQGLILDLRNNGGGYLDTAVDVASEFLPGGEVVLYEEYKDGSRKAYKSLGGGLATDIPMVVLVNKGTASASEIVSGALQDYGRALLVGETTYGKGSVQNWIPLEHDQGAVRITVALWLTPKGRQISGKGLTPDVEVPMTEDDFKAKRDPQLDKAIELILQGKAPATMQTK